MPRKSDIVDNGGEIIIGGGGAITPRRAVKDNLKDLSPPKTYPLPRKVSDVSNYQRLNRVWKAD